MRNFLLISLFVFVALISLYGATAGWVSAELTSALQTNKTSSPRSAIEYDGLQWVNEDAMRRYKTVQTAAKWFPWAVGMPQPIALVLTSLAFGCLGGILRVAFDRVMSKEAIRGHDFAVLGLSALIGLFILGVSYVIPAALTVSDATVRPVALLFLCGLGGAFYDHIFMWGREQIEKIFERR